MRTALPDVLAAGDVCRAYNAAAGRPLRVEHWGDALGQGEVAGATRRRARPPLGRRARLLVDDRRRSTLKYAAWGDGYDDLPVRAPAPTARFTAGTAARA